MRGKWLFGAAFVALSTLGLGAGAALAQSAGDPPGDNSTTSVLTPGAPVSGALSPAGDTDWYKLVVAPGQMYRIALNGAGEDAVKLADPLLILHGVDGAEIARNDDGPEGLDSLLRYTPTQAGTVFVEARGFADDATGAYTLSVDQSAIPPDNAANDKSTRARLAAGQTVQGALEYEGDTDWFRLSVRTGQIYHLSLDAGGGDAGLSDPLLILHDANGDEIARNDDAPPTGEQGGTLNSRLDYVPSARGDVFVEARGFNENATGAYVLRAETSALPHDDFANGRNTRGRLAVGQTQRGAIEYGGDVDWLRVTLADGQIYRFQAKSAAGEGPLADPVIRLLDAQGTELASDDDGGEGFNSYLEFTAPRAGNYFVEVRSFDSTATGAYDVSAAAGDIPGDATTDAALSADGDYREGRIGAPGDTDWYRVDMKAGQSVRIALDSATEGGVGDPLLAIHGSDGAELASDDDGGEGLNSWLEFTAPSAGAYYIEAKGFSSDATGGYAINLTAGEIPAQADGAEPLAAGGDGRESIISPNDDADWFSIDLVEGRPYRFFVNGAAENGLADPVITLYDADGRQIASDDNGGSGANAYLYFASPTGGAYYAAVSSANHAGSGRYSIRASDTDVPGNVGTDEELQPEPSDDRFSRIEMIGDLDWYRVELVANVRYEISVSGDGDTPLTDPFLAVLNANGEQIASDDDSGPGLDARLRFTPEATDTYYVQASGLSGSTGGYKVSIVRR
ncbi:MAG TPA: PPC domain-containing protein [Caulobacterales bacterium]|nr:PPC domain-containing protein [Caulobacterales bacterium]